MAARGENVLGVLGLFLVKLAEHSLPQDFREANNGIERSSQFVGHVGEELRLMAEGSIAKARHDRTDSRATNFPLIQEITDLNWSSGSHRPPRSPLTQTERGCPNGFNQLFFHTMARPEMELLAGNIVLVNNSLSVPES